MKRNATKNKDGYPADPLIDEVRAIRAEIWKQDGNDLQTHFKRLQEIEQKHPQRIAKLNAHGRLARRRTQKKSA